MNDVTPFRNSLRRLAITAASSVLVLTSTASARAEDTVTDPFPGVRRLHRVTTDQNINVLTVNLCQDGVSLRATKPEEKGRTTSSFGLLVNAQAAVNGDFFVTGFDLQRGFAAGGGIPWPPSAMADDETTGQLAIGQNRVELILDKAITKSEGWMTDVVGGRPTVLSQGTLPNTDAEANLCLRNPRTSVGLSQDKKTLFVAVVDGRAATRVGMTCTELGLLMKDLGAYDALNFDGGGSSTMWMQADGVLNFPTDGKERTVGNHLAIFASGSGAANACPPPPEASMDLDASVVVNPENSRNDHVR